MIQEITFEECLKLWHLLWLTRVSPIEPTSAMTLPNHITLERQYSNDVGNPTFLGYHQDGKLVGVNSFHRVSDSMRSRGLFVLDSCRGKGIAHQLLGETIRRAGEHFYVWSYPKKEALSVYLKAGFKLVTDGIYDPIEQKWNYYVKT
jgi:GNAT superfamily N-acetyltransferase